MADFKLAFKLGFPKCTPEWRIEEQWIIPKPISPLGFVEQQPFHFPPKCANHVSSARQSYHRYEPCPTISNTAHLLQHQPVVGFIRSIRTGVARRVHPGSAAQCIYLESRIVDKEQLVAKSRIVNGFLDRVLFEGCAGLLGWLDLAQSSERFHFQRAAKLNQLAGIGGGAIDHCPES